MILQASPHLSENFTVDVSNIPTSDDHVDEIGVDVTAEFRCQRLQWVCGLGGLTVLHAASQHTYQGARYEYEPPDLSTLVGNSNTLDPSCSGSDTPNAGGKGNGNGSGGAPGGVPKGLGGNTGHGGSTGHGGANGKGGHGGAQADPSGSCPPGQTAQADGSCTPAKGCPSGQVPSATGCKPPGQCPAPGTGTGTGNNGASVIAAGPSGPGSACPYTPPSKCPPTQKLDPVTATCVPARDGGTGGSGGAGGASSGGASGNGGNAGSGGACSVSQCQTLENQIEAEQCEQDNDLLLDAFAGLDFSDEINAETKKVKTYQKQAQTCSCPGAAGPEPGPSAGSCPPKRPKKNKPCPIHTPEDQLNDLLAKCKSEFPGGSNEVFYRVQGGKMPQASQVRIQRSSSTNSGVSVEPGAFCVSKNGMSHAQYFAQMRANQMLTQPGNGASTPVALYQWEMPHWFAKCVDKISVPQKNFSCNANNLNGLAPKIVDPNQPGDSYEFNSPWYKAFEQYAVPNSLDICGYTPQADAGAGP